jgi:hypothetical protein
MSCRRELRSFALVFPSELSAEQVVRWIHAVSGTLATGPSRIVQAPPVLVCECRSDARGVCFRLRVPTAQATFVVGQLRTLLPGVRVVPEFPAEPVRWTRVVELGLHRLDRTLRIPEPETAAASLLASVGNVGHREAVLLQVVVSPAVPERPPEHLRAVPRGRRNVVRLDDLFAEGNDRTKDRRAKLADGPNLLGVLRVAAYAGSPKRAGQLLAPVRQALTSARTADNGFYKRLVPTRTLHRRLAAGRAPALFPAQFSASELAAIIAWPMAQPHVAGLPQSRTRHLAPTAAIPAAGLAVARANFPGAERPLALTARTATTHLHIVGPTETGKTTLLASLARQAMEAGAGLIIIESKGDAFHAAMDAVPDKRVDDVIIFDVSEASRPVGYNVLGEGNPRVAVEELCQLFEHLYPDMRRGVWARAALHRGLSTLITRPGATFIDLVPLLSAAARSDTETAWRNELIADVRDPELKRFWQRFTALPPSQQEGYASPILDRIWQLQERPEIRNIIGQSTSSFTMREVLRDKKVLLVNLAGLGRTTASLVGTLMINSLWSAVRSGAARGSQPACLLLDEFQDFVNLPVDPEELFAKARSFGLSITAAHQHLGQLPPELRQAVLANARSKIVFQTTADDARVFSREFGRYVSEEDFLNLGRFEVLMKLMGADGVSSPVTGTTYPPAPPTGNAAAVRHRSRMRYGRPLADVEAEIQQRRTPRREPPRPQRPRVGPQKWE